MKLTGTQSVDPPELWAEHPVSHAYASGKTHNAVSINAGATNQVALSTKGHARMTLIAELAATVTIGDLVAEVYPVLDDGTTVAGAPLKALTDSGVVSDGTNVWAVRVYELAGIDNVKVSIKNNNAGAKSATAVYYLQR